MAAWFVIALIYIGGFVVYELLRPKPKFDSPSPAGLGDFKFATIGEGRAVPWIAGTVLMPGPAVTWYGDLRVVAITEKIRTGLFSSETITKGYKYYLGIELVFCTGPIDDVLELRFDDRPIPIATKSPVGSVIDFVIDQASFFGGDEEEGGIKGVIRVYRGTEVQVPDPYLENKIGTDLPAYRGVCRAVFQGVYLGTSPYLKPFAMVVKKIPNQLALTGGDEEIAGDANAAAMMYDIATTEASRNGLGMSPGTIDVANWRTVGATIASDTMGLSMVQDRFTTGKELVLDILRHVDCAMFVEPSTGLLTLKLIRLDYNPATLPVLDKDNCNVKQFTRPDWTSLPNAVRISYVDRADGFVEKTVQAQELAAIDIQGGEINYRDFDFRGFSTAANAQRAAGRALKAVGFALATASIEAGRIAWDFRPGTPAKLNWPPLGISGMVIRMLEVQSGSLVDGKITMEVVEDVFGVTWTGYSDPPPSGWTDPAGSVPALTAIEAFAAPYPSVSFLTAWGLQARAITMASRGDGVTKGYLAYAKIDGVWSPSLEVTRMTPSGMLDAAADEKATSIVVQDGIDTDLIETVGDAEFAAGYNAVWIGGEIICFKTVTPGSGIVTLSDLARGCVDTVPMNHLSGRVWFLSYGHGLIGIENSVGPPLDTDVRFQAFNNRGEIPFASAPDDQATADSPQRATLPFAPTDFKVNGVSYPDPISGEMTISWEHRDRLADWTYADSGKTDAQESGVTYTITVWGELGGIVHIETGITGKSWTYLTATEIAESGLGRLNNHLKVRLEAIRGSDTGYFYIEWEFDRV